MSEDTEFHLTEQDIERLKAKDERFAKIDLAIKIDEELQHSPTVNLILDTVARHSTQAMELLIDADPTDAKRVSALQAMVKYGRFIGETFEYIRKEGIMAQMTLEEEGNVDLDKDAQHE